MALLFAWDYNPKEGMLTTVITGTPVPGVSMVTVSSDRTQLTLSGVQREVDGATVMCTALASTERINSNPATISVKCKYVYAVVIISPHKHFTFSLLTLYTHADPPVYSLLPNQPTTMLEGEGFTYSFGLEANPTPVNFTWSRDSQVISSGGRIATSVSTISITSTTRSDSGVYEVVSYNEAGRGAGNFTLDVQCEPSFILKHSFHLHLHVQNGLSLSQILQSSSLPSAPPS